MLYITESATIITYLVDSQGNDISPSTSRGPGLATSGMVFHPVGQRFVTRLLPNLAQLNLPTRAGRMRIADKLSTTQSIAARRCPH